MASPLGAGRDVASETSLDGSWRRRRGAARRIAPGPLSRVASGRSDLSIPGANAPRIHRAARR